jgi:hypothetical protein
VWFDIQESCFLKAYTHLYLSTSFEHVCVCVCVCVCIYSTIYMCIYITMFVCVCECVCSGIGVVPLVKFVR